MAFIITPLAFALAGYLLISVAFASSIESITGFWNFLTAEGATHESEDLMINRLDGYTDSVPSSLISFPSVGDRYGELTIESANIEKAPVYFGDDKKVLSRGIGQYSGSMFIGSGSTVLLSGHNNTYLHTLGESKIGDKVLLSTNYGDYVYEITETAVKNSGDSTAFDLGADYENLVIYTCYPFDTLGLTSKRYFVYCKYVSGPKILYNK